MARMEEVEAARREQEKLSGETDRKIEVCKVRVESATQWTTAIDT